MIKWHNLYFNHHHHTDNNTNVCSRILKNRLLLFLLFELYHFVMWLNNWYHCTLDKYSSRNMEYIVASDIQIVRMVWKWSPLYVWIYKYVSKAQIQGKIGNHLTQVIDTLKKPGTNEMIQLWSLLCRTMNHYFYTWWLFSNSP